MTLGDPNWISWLQNNGYAACMNGNQIDTSCSPVLSATDMDCSNSNIEDIYGIWFFKNLQRLNCSNNGALFGWQGPVCPLPPRLKYLDCSHTWIGNIFNKWPDSLVYLNINYSSINPCPSFPNTLQELDCGATIFSTLPPFPQSLRTLYCEGSELSELPELPDGLTYMRLAVNFNLYCLPKLPDGLYFEYYSSLFTCLPNRHLLGAGGPPLDSMPICDYLNVHGCTVYAVANGNVYLDVNGNCVFDYSDIGLRDVNVAIYDSVGNYLQNIFTASNGDFSFEVPNGTFTIKVDTSRFGLDCGGQGSYTFTIANNVANNLNFALNCPSQCGADVSTITAGVHGERLSIFTDNSVRIWGGNLSNTDSTICNLNQQGTVTVVINGPVSYIGPIDGTTAPIYVNGDTVVWNIVQMYNPTFPNSLIFAVHNDSSARLGDSVCFTAILNSSTCGIYNRTISKCFVIADAIDPNEKDVDPSGQIDTTQRWLTYNIHFQNTGNAAAQNIYILDTLSNVFDPSSVQLLTSCSEPVLQVLPGGILRFNFPDINLPDSARNQAGSNCYVQYKVRLRDGLPLGTPVSNSASIYFDLAPPVVTNTAQNFICNTVYVDTTVTINCGDSITIGIHIYHTNGTYIDSLLTENGCDSIITLHLHSTNDTIEEFGGLCAGDSILFFGTWIYQVGEYDTVVHGTNGCDTYGTLTLVVIDPLPPHHEHDTICNGDSLLFRGGYLTVAGTYNHIGCDSSVILNLVVLPRDTVSASQVICRSDSVLFHGAYVHAPGTYTGYLNNATGCDTLDILTLNLLPPVYDTVSVTTHCGDTTLFNGAVYISAGYYTDTLTTVSGCDSLVTLHLTTINDTVNLFGGLCAGDSINFYGTWIYQVGVGEYDTIIPGTNGCDTFATLTLAIIDPLPPHHIYDTICRGDTVLFAGQYLTTTGTYSHISCDSSVILGLVVDTVPVVTFTWDSAVYYGYVEPPQGGMAQWCPVVYPSAFPLTGGLPTGGHYSGNGVLNDTLYAFIQSQNQLGPDTLSYTYFDGNNCSTSAQLVIDLVICVRVERLNNITGLTIYPNPASTQLNIKADGRQPDAVIMYNVSGQKIYSGKFEPVIDIATLASGVYFIEVKTGNDIWRHRFVKM